METITIEIHEASIVVDAPNQYNRSDIERALRGLAFQPDFVAANDIGGDMTAFHFTI